jgi:hypothetical protein
VGEFLEDAHESPAADLVAHMPVSAYNRILVYFICFEKRRWQLLTPPSHAMEKVTLAVDNYGQSECYV